MKNYYLKIYLAGKMTGLSFDEMNRWRVIAKEQLIRSANIAGCPIKVINPVDYFNFKEKRYQSLLEVKEYDLAHVISSDVVLVNLKGLDSSDGSKFEIHDAHYHNKIPVVAFGEMNLYENLHSWVQDDITRVENNVFKAVQYISDFYMS